MDESSINGQRMSGGEGQVLRYAMLLQQRGRHAIAIVFIVTLLSLGVTARAYWLTTDGYRRSVLTAVQKEGERSQPELVRQFHGMADELRPVAMAELEAAIASPQLWVSVERERQQLVNSLEVEFAQLAEESLASLADSSKVNDALKGLPTEKQVKTKEVVRAALHRLGRRLFEDQRLAERINRRLDHFSELSDEELGETSASAQLLSCLAEQLLWGGVRHLTDDTADRLN